MKKTLVLFAHPYFEHSTTNVELIKAYQNNPNVIFRDLYEDYPDFHIQPFRERKRIVDFDRIIFHYPMIWFGMPPLLKLWLEEVFDMKWLNEGFPNPLAGKECAIVVTVGGNEESYSKNGRYKVSLTDLTLGLKLSIESNDMLLKDELYIYQADDLKIYEIKPFTNQLKKILDN